MPLKDYALAIGNIISPINVLSISKIFISKASRTSTKVCSFLNNSVLVNTLVNTVQYINIGNQFISIERFAFEDQPTIIYNIVPAIPNDIFVRELNKLGIPLISEIKSINASINETGYEHVLSFEREVYFDVDDLSKIPQSIDFYYEGHLFFIYFTIKSIHSLTTNTENIQNINKNDDQKENAINLSIREPELPTIKIDAPDDSAPSTSGSNSSQFFSTEEIIYDLVYDKIIDIFNEKTDENNE